jgi:acetaldehyde dehydrogenase/alcohol dehydrogenase
MHNDSTNLAQGAHSRAEAKVACIHLEDTDAQALQALKILKDCLPAAFLHGANDPTAREKVHNASCIAGIAFAHAFLGVCHSMAHKLGAGFGLAHGLANELLISYVIRYNAADIPTKQTAFSQYDRPKCVERYAQIAKYLGLDTKSDHKYVEKLVAWVDGLNKVLGIPASIQAAGVNEVDFLAKVDNLAEAAFDDQCTGVNPRFPLISELKELLIHSYYGRAYQECTSPSRKK